MGITVSTCNYNMTPTNDTKSSKCTKCVDRHMCRDTAVLCQYFGVPAICRALINNVWTYYSHTNMVQKNKPIYEVKFPKSYNYSNYNLQYILIKKCKHLMYKKTKTKHD